MCVVVDTMHIKYIKETLNHKSIFMYELLINLEMHLRLQKGRSLDHSPSGVQEMLGSPTTA